MAVALDTLISRSIKNMGAIDSQVSDYAVELIRRAYAEGIYVQISSGYRSNEEQAKIYAQGRTAPGKIVSNAKPGTSMHNYGLAIDYFLVSDDGKTALWTVNAKWRRVAAIAKAMGFEWGGDWKGFVDYPHLQMNHGLTIAQLKAGKRPTLKPLKAVAGVANSDKVMWGKTELKRGQIGKLTILKPINLWKDSPHASNELVEVRVLQPGEEYRVYKYRDDHGGQYNVGDGHWITKMDGFIRYETPSKAMLEKLNGK